MTENNTDKLADDVVTIDVTVAGSAIDTAKLLVAGTKMEKKMNQLNGNLTVRYRLKNNPRTMAIFNGVMGYIAMLTDTKAKSEDYVGFEIVQGFGNKSSDTTDQAK